jgi:hypothetical protein
VVTLDIGKSNDSLRKTPPTSCGQGDVVLLNRFSGHPDVKTLLQVSGIVAGTHFPNMEIRRYPDSDYEITFSGRSI